jgi:hypothetical protein
MTRNFQSSEAEVANPTKSVALTSVGQTIARRSLIRAGLAAAPVMLALKSQSALATTGAECKPSVWASLKAAKGCQTSHMPQGGYTKCKHYSDWAQSNHTECTKKYHAKAGRSANQYVPLYGDHFGTESSLKDICGGNKRVLSSGRYVMQPISDAGLDKLGKHCAAMILNVRVDKNCPLDEPTIKKLWQDCKTTGRCSPATGVSWTASDCNEYFDFVCGKSTFVCS